MRVGLWTSLVVGAGLGAGCDCEGAEDWQRTFAVSIFGIRPAVHGLSELEVITDVETWSCEVDFRGEDAEHVDCDDPDLINSVWFDGEWLTVWNVGRIFPLAELRATVRNDDGEVVAAWADGEEMAWAGDLTGELACGDVRGSVVRDLTGNRVRLP